MRSFIITVSIFLLLTVCICLNYNYIHGVHGQMEEMVSLISEEPSAANEILIDGIYDYWKSNSCLISISVGSAEMDALSNAIYAVRAANTHKDKVQLTVNIELLKKAIDSIIRLERLSFENIF